MFEWIVKRLQSKSDVPDLIAVLDLGSWYRELSDTQRKKLHEYSTAFSTGGESDMLQTDVSSTTQTAQGYLQSVGASAASQKDYEFAAFVLEKALKQQDGSVTDTHFTYNELIDVYYKQRDERDDAIEKCIKYCKEDIAIADDFIDEFGEVPRIPAFKRLAIIYERQERYEDAVAVCEQAFEIGTTDGTNGGFEGRIERLQKKMNN